MNHLKTGNAYFGTGSYKNRKYNGKELQETGMYSYGWRDYMPDIARWNGIDQLAENYLSTSTYAYVATNPVSYADVDGRWFNEDGSIDTSGTANGFVNTRALVTQSLGQYPGDGGGGGGNGYTFTGTAASSMFNYFANGGDINGISFNKGYAMWSTLDDASNSMYNDSDAMLTGSTGGVTLNKAKVDDNTFWEEVSKKLGVFGFANDVKMQLIEAGVRNNAGLTIREFNALNTSAQEIRTLGALGYTGSKYLTAFKSLGVAASVVTTAYSATKVYDQYQKGGAGEVFNHRDVVDTTVGVIGLGTTALVAIGLVSNPVGWAIGIGVLVYGTGTMIYDLSNEP